jgi:hypothetical protein
MKARRFGTVIGLLVLCAVLWALTPHFLTVSNLLNIAQQTSINAIVAAGMTFVISVGRHRSVGRIDRGALRSRAGRVVQGDQPPMLPASCWRLRSGRERAGQRRVDQHGPPAAVHRHARHDERRARRGA